METPKKYSSGEKLNFVQESSISYEKENNLTANDSDELHPILIKLIEKSRLNHKGGKGIPHDEVMRRVKLKYPFLK